MLRVLLPLVVLLLTIYCLVDCVQTSQSQQRNLPKIAWIIIILLFPPVGGVAWLIAGRPRSILPGNRGGGGPRGGRHPGPRGPDDDPDFLRGL